MLDIGYQYWLRPQQNHVLSRMDITYISDFCLWYHWNEMLMLYGDNYGKVISIH